MAVSLGSTRSGGKAVLPDRMDRILSALEAHSNGKRVNWHSLSDRWSISLLLSRRDQRLLASRRVLAEDGFDRSEKANDQARRWWTSHPGCAVWGSHNTSRRSARTMSTPKCCRSSPPHTRSASSVPHLATASNCAPRFT